MSFVSEADLFRILIALVLLLTAAHLMGRLFSRLRQPPVIGEIVSGLLLGPTLLGVLAPGVQAWIFPREGAVAAGLGLVYQMGVLLLMFLAGAEMRTVFRRQDGRTVGMIAVTGLVIPFLLGLLFVAMTDVSGLVGPARNEPALTLILACAIAVTSIPVISRIMLDLGIMQSAFARIVLSVAVLEDVVLNMFIAIALGVANQSLGREFGVVALLDIRSLEWSIGYHAAASVGFFVFAAVLGVVWRRRWTRPRPAAGGAAGGVAVRVALTLSMAASCVLLGIAPIFGAFVVGLMMGSGQDSANAEPIATIRGFAGGFFVPVYFAIVGLKLDLVKDLALWFTLGFIAFACAAKASSVYLGARLSGNPPLGSVNLAVAMNARGGPGIVLATLSYDAGIINAELFTTLVLTAIVTSLMAGSWLQAMVARGLLTTSGPEKTSPPQLETAQR